MNEKRGVGRPATGHKGKRTSIYLLPAWVFWWGVIANVRKKSKRVVLEEALSDYAGKHDIELPPPPTP
jgi:hypothetical protein